MSALKQIAEGYGLGFETVARSDDLKQARPDTADLLVRPNFTNMNFMGRPPVLFLMDETAVFAGPAHFAKVIESDYYQGLISAPRSSSSTPSWLVRRMEARRRFSPRISPPDPRRSAGPDDDRDLWILVVAGISKELGIGFDEVLDHTEFKIADSVQR